jgi:hypothetical protein
VEEKIDQHAEDAESGETVALLNLSTGIVDDLYTKPVVVVAL